MQNNPHTPRVRNGEPQPASALSPEPVSARRDLTSWWRQFSKRPAKKEEEKEPVLPGIFGVPLIQSIPYANVAISLFNEHGESYIYGYVPIVVAKCGVYLKEKATDVEGIFRLAGSEKRIKELKAAFDTPPRYGKGLDWTGYTVHDAANILRRYFNHLPEPIIPLGYYESLREPLRGHQAEAVGPIEGQSPSLGGFDPNAAVRTYQHHIKSLPSLNRQLLLYILDLLAVFAAKSDINKMTTHNLAAIFQPGILSHPMHDMSPVDYRLSQDVLIFLIDNQDHFLIGMEGTAVDERTLKHVESGPTTPQAKTPTTPVRTGSGELGRSASTSSSAAAEGLLKNGGLRRNVSTSSKRSRQSGVAPSPITPSFGTPSTSGVHRRNTLPSKRSPALGSPRFAKRENSGPVTPEAEDLKSPLSPLTPANTTASGAQPQPTAKFVNVAEAANIIHNQAQTNLPIREPEPEPESTLPKRAQTMPPERIELPKAEPTLPVPLEKPASVTPAIDQIPGGYPLPSPGLVSPTETITPSTLPPVVPALQIPTAGAPHHATHHTPTREKSEFIEGPIDVVDTGLSPEHHSSGRTFTQILSKSPASPSSEAKDARKPNKLQKKRMPHSANPSAHSSTHSLTGGSGPDALQGPPSPLQPPHPPFAQGYSQASGSKEVLAHQTENSASRNSGTTLKPSMSPSTSFRSHSTTTEYSEADHGDEQHKDERRSFWKGGHKRGESKATPTASQTDLHGSVPGGDRSMSSFASSSGFVAGGRSSLQHEQRPHVDSWVHGSPPDNDKAENKGAFGWFHKMRSEHKERAEKRERAKSPPGSAHHLPGQQSLKPQENARGRSIDITRPAGSGEESAHGVPPEQAYPHHGQITLTTTPAVSATQQAHSAAPATQQPGAQPATAAPPQHMQPASVQQMQSPPAQQPPTPESASQPQSASSSQSRFANLPVPSEHKSIARPSQPAAADFAAQPTNASSISSTAEIGAAESAASTTPVQTSSAPAASAASAEAGSNVVPGVAPPSIAAAAAPTTAAAIPLSNAKPVDDTVPAPSTS